MTTDGIKNIKLNIYNNDLFDTKKYFNRKVENIIRDIKI